MTLAMVSRVVSYLVLDTSHCLGLYITSVQQPLSFHQYFFLFFICRALDFMSLMSYNLYSGADTRTGYNAPWEPVSDEGTVVGTKYCYCSGLVVDWYPILCYIIMALN